MIEPTGSMSQKGTQRWQNAKTLIHIGGNLQTPPIGLWSLDFGAMTIACFAKNKFGAARDESPRLLLMLSVFFIPYNIIIKI